MLIIDLSQTIDAHSLSYPGEASAIRFESIDSGVPDCQVTCFRCFDPHVGTHIDAPAHFVAGGGDAASLPPYVLPGIVIDLEDLVRTGAVRQSLQGQAVLIRTGWERYAGQRAYFRNHPGLDRASASVLADRGVKLVGIDAPSIDRHDAAPEFPAHHVLLGRGIPVVEGLIALRQLRAGEPFEFFCLPLKLGGVEASPVRAIAILGSRVLADNS